MLISVLLPDVMSDRSQPIHRSCQIHNNPVLFNPTLTLEHFIASQYNLHKAIGNPKYSITAKVASVTIKDGDIYSFNLEHFADVNCPLRHAAEPSHTCDTCNVLHV